MKKMIKYGVAAVCLFLAFCMETGRANAAEETFGGAAAGMTQTEEIIWKDPFVVVESYELSHERIIPGEGFTLTLHLKNNSTTRTAQQALVDVTNPQGVAPVYGTVSQTYLGDMKPGEGRTVVYEYDSWPTITSETLDFAVVIASHGNTNYVTLRVPTGTDSIFHVMATNGPTAVYVNEAASASLNFRVLGDENVSNVVLRMDCNGETIGTSQVGSLSAGTTKTQSVSFVMTQAGEYTVDFYMEYMGADGSSKTEFLGTKTIEVAKKESADPNALLPGGDMAEESPSNTSIIILVLSGILIFAIFVVSAVIMKKKR